VIEVMADVNVIGSLEAKFESTNRIYDVGGCSPTLSTMQGGNQEPKILESQIVAMRGRNPDNPSDTSVGSPTEQRLEANTQGTSNCLTSVQKDNLVMESSVLTPKRTEYGKAIRKAYENGEVQESRHNMTELEPRTDGVSNTLTTVQKDNLVIEPQYRIRKLTPRECGRLMGVSDEDISKMAAVNSNTQMYKQFGNSIVVDVMCAMFKNLNIEQGDGRADE
jgi:site-specific DNA-cytosine methylase